jgi:DNA-directed RNA polymerase alpha subunit
MSSKTTIIVIVAGTVLGLAFTAFCVGMYQGLINYRKAIDDELAESGKAILDLNRNFKIEGLNEPPPDQPIEDLGLSDAVLRALKAAKIEIVTDLLKKSEAELLKVPGIDRPALEEINAALDKKGHSLRFSLEEK